MESDVYKNQLQSVYYLGMHWVTFLYEVIFSDICIADNIYKLMSQCQGKNKKTKTNKQQQKSNKTTTTTTTKRSSNAIIIIWDGNGGGLYTFTKWTWDDP